ncbi:nardilysin-like [Rosa chinensis]|uniref:nardilysin-like n=1 Tax=Rosa chinensis TaxID=74649 RepID=UPI001AD8AB7C|nr:nardilysin-like [Rosa chinensis]
MARVAHANQILKEGCFSFYTLSESEHFLEKERPPARDCSIFIFSSDDVVLKSRNERSLYRLIKLENGLTALLVHDPEIGESQLSEGSEEDDDSEGEDEDELNKKKGGDSRTNKAAAAMWVGIGSFSDPPEAQGLAHFLEHMLFMGSTEFSDENELITYPSTEGVQILMQK